MGRCLYCERRDRLSEEHIIPLGLGGLLIVQAASCPSCNRTTSAFELSVLRGFMAAARAVAGFPTRRPRERPSTVPVTLKRGSDAETHHVPLGSATALLPLPRFDTIGLFSGRPMGGDILLIGQETIRFGVDPQLMAASLGPGDVVLHGKWEIIPFARMLAKIGIGCVSSELGSLPLADVPLLDFVHTGVTTGVSHWLGSTHVEVAPELQGATHVVSVHYRDHPIHRERRLAIARIRLFANSGATGYEVVVLDSLRSAPVFAVAPG